MNLQQLRYVAEVAQRNLNVSEAARALHTSQSGVSRQISLLEAELGVDVFIRQGKRLVAMTRPGEEVVAIARRMLRDIGALRQVGEEYAVGERGRLTIAMTHTQARYVLPSILPEFMRAHPEVKVALHQGNPTQCCEYVLSGEADLAIATEAIDEYEQLISLPCYQWNRCLITPPGHPLLSERPLTLAAIAEWPLITYDFAFTGGSTVNRAFAAQSLSPNIMLSAIDADIIKTYVALGLGVGIVAQMAFDPEQDRALRALDCAHLFEPSTTRIGLHRNAWLRGYTYDFIEQFASALNRDVVDQALGRG
ncbi:CysB family HTH-type transcriptional regulator [Methyloversatilis sp.]|uniref:CysB family HTH-type transcriptional regulator n=1 Tax=Methyloversatilis sp. TaxID=2569862 RepID=UPI00273615B0|nr:CysB family HTH-type transcriptional regulator [Methyloversatilis sp.]MDP2869313.1 CysB family HTH-type transcriptional regulator [Methyloversatilis sp.]MDP3287143.1 CysB family HTH-type transcriptional regulator [Methyloversatilis sp.]MDP3456898.1 CysB family HTH-type transcriptional regulator [Methyloversatilis sp.]MDP3580092.1 CysB family HTH-type transcriptional regulator [Methyloversatilis sp.]